MEDSTTTTETSIPSNVYAFKPKSETIQNYETSVTDLLNQKAFYAKLIMSMQKVFTKIIPTAGVGIKSTGISLYINPEFFNSLDRKGRVAILEHEALHVIHAHFGRFNNFQGKDRRLANYACDLAINQFIPNLPEKFMVPDGKGGMIEGNPVTFAKVKKQIPDLLPKMSSEYYYGKFKEEQEKNGQGGDDSLEGIDLTDDHGEWEKSDLTEEQLEKMVKSHVKAILETCSDEEKKVLDKTIIDELYKSEINWKAQLRTFFANSEEVFTETTRKKRNRRYGLLQAGHKHEPKLKLGISVDTSGSISNDELQIFFSEIARMYDENTMELWVIEADCVIRDFYEYQKGMKIEAKGRSGTAYMPAINKMIELKVDAAIYFGDFDIADQITTKPKFPFLWAGVRNSPPPVTWGKVIRVDCARK